MEEALLAGDQKHAGHYERLIDEPVAEVAGMMMTTM